MAKFKVGDKVEIKKKKHYFSSFGSMRTQEALEETAGKIGEVISTHYDYEVPLVRVETKQYSLLYETSAVKHVK